jgi:hypothetical protein
MGTRRMTVSYKDILRDNPDPEFVFVDPPFNFNAPRVAKFPPDVSGYFLLKSLCRRLSWPSLAGKNLLDFGCGVRFARTILNLGLDIGSYIGVDVNEESIGWLIENVKDPRFRFEQLNVRNLRYNREGRSETDLDLLKNFGFGPVDAACMYSVITHQCPQEAALTFSMLRRCVPPGAALYFTAILSENIDEFIEGQPDRPGKLSAYNPDFLMSIVQTSGWQVEAAYGQSTLQQPGFLCR